MFSQGRGAGLSPGTSAHNPSAFSKPAKETEWGKGGREGRERREGEKSSQTERTCFSCDSGVNDESHDIWEKQWKAEWRGRIRRIDSLYAKLIKILCVNADRHLCKCSSVSHHYIHMPRSAWLQSLANLPISLREDGLLYKSSPWLSHSQHSPSAAALHAWSRPRLSFFNKSYSGTLILLKK